MNEVNPEKTYALVVGVEKYQEGFPDLDGPARDAVQFAIWLLKQNVNPDNIGLFISPLEEGKFIQKLGEKEEKFNQIPRKPATSENIRSFIYHQLHNQSQSGELLYVFWSGHGVATSSQEQTERRLIFSDSSKNIDPRNLNLNSLVNALKFPEKKKGFEQQIYLIDACANIMHSNKYQASELKFTSLGAAPRKQYILFAVTEGATAYNQNGGKFSQAVFEELKHQPLLPDMDHVATEVENQLTSDGMKPTFWKRDWYGNDENNLGSLLSDSDTLTPEEQKKIVCQFLEKVENEFKDIKLFHLEREIPLTQQYISIKVTLERRYKKLTEDIGSYAESEEEKEQIDALQGIDKEQEKMKKIYAIKGINEEEFKQQQVDWEEARQDHQKIMVLADPGMGKSTLLRMEALRIAKEEREKLETGEITVEKVVLPIFLRLSELATEVNKPEFEFLPEAIADVIKQIYSDRTEFEKIQPLMVEKIKKGQCFLLLDAWDEVEQDYRTNLKSKLDNLKQIDCLIIATSRIVGYTSSPIEGIKEVEIVPFDQQQTENYIKTWFENAKRYPEDESVSAENLIKELQDRPQINGLVKNPLLLSLICSLYQTKKLDLPAKRSEIYKQAVNCMLKEWRNQRKEQNPFHIDFKKEVLESFAYQISCEGKEVFEIRELRKKITSFLKEEQPTYNPNAMITELSEEDGIIQTINLDKEEEKKYIFLHRTFQEYFTASYLNESEDPISLAQQFFWNYDQHETLILLAGLMDDPTPLIQAIYQEKDDIFKTQLLLAGRCLAECEDFSTSIVTEIINKIYQFWHQYPSLYFIKSTVVLLGQTSLEMFQLLSDALKDENQSVRYNAAQVLGRIGSRQAAPPLIAALEDNDREVSYIAAEALGKINTEQAVQPLIVAIKGKDRYVSYGAAEALGKINTEQAVQPLITALQDEDSFVRSNVAEALGKINLEQAVQPLITALQDEDKFVRSSVAEALGEIGSQQAVQPLITALQDEDSFVKSNVAKALGEINSEQAIQPLITALNNELISTFGENNAIKNIANVLGKINKEQAVQPLIVALRSDNSNVRKNAAEALGEINSEQAVQLLITALQDDEDSFVRQTVAEALGKIHSEQVVQPLSMALEDDKDKYVRCSATQALGKIGSEKAVKALVMALGNDDDGDVRAGSALALGKIRSQQGVEPLIAALEDKDRKVRMIVALALGEIGSEQALQPLIAALKDLDRYVKYSAAKALSQIGSEQALQPLMTIINRKEYDLRRMAILALSEIGTAKVLKHLLQCSTVNIYEPELFFVARRTAIQLNAKQLSFIPVYPKFVKYSPLKASIQRFLLNNQALKKVPILPTATLAILITLIATIATLHFSGIYSLPFLRESESEKSSSSNLEGQLKVNIQTGKKKN